MAHEREARQMVKEYAAALERRDAGAGQRALAGLAGLIASVDALPAADAPRLLGTYAAAWRELWQLQDDRARQLAVELARAIMAKLDGSGASGAPSLKQRPWAREVRDFVQRYGRRTYYQER